MTIRELYNWAVEHDALDLTMIHNEDPYNNDLIVPSYIKLEYPEVETRETMDKMTCDEFSKEDRVGEGDKFVLFWE